MAVCNGITYDAINDRITVEYNALDGTKGASYSNPYTFQDVYDTDVNGGWGYVDKLENSYVITKKLYLYNSATYFADSDCYVLFKDQNNYVFYNVSGRIKFTRVKFSTNNPYSGIRWITSSSAELTELTSCRFEYFSYVETRNSLIKNCTFNNNSYVYLRMNMTYQNCAMYNCNAFWILGNGTIENSLITEFIYGLWIDNRYASGEITVKNIQLTGCTYDFRFRLWQNNLILNAIDCKADINSYYTSVENSDPGTTELNLKSTFSSDIENGSGGTLTIYDKDDNVVYSEELSSDEMTPQEITYARKYYENENGVITVDELNIYEPFTLKITKTGYQTLEIPNITIESGSPTNIYGKMELPVPPVYYQQVIQGTVSVAEVSGTIEVSMVEGEIN